MAEMVRYGIIGTGMMGCEHIRNIAAIEGAEVTAIADPDERSRGFGYLSAGEDPGLEIYRDYRELLHRAPVDAVVVASPAAPVRLKWMKGTEPASSMAARNPVRRSR